MIKSVLTSLLNISFSIFLSKDLFIYLLRNLILFYLRLANVIFYNNSDILIPCIIYTMSWRNYLTFLVITLLYNLSIISANWFYTFLTFVLIFLKILTFLLISLSCIAFHFNSILASIINIISFNVTTSKRNILLSSLSYVI